MDNINQVESKKKKISCKFCGYEHAPERKKCPAWGKVCKRCKKKNDFAKGCKDAAVNAIGSDEDLEEISVVRVQAMKDKAVFAKMPLQQKPVKFKLTVELVLTFCHLSTWKMWISSLVPSPSSCGMAPRSSLLGPVHCELLIPETIRSTK